MIAAATDSLFLIEFYNAREMIQFAWVAAFDRTAAINKLSNAKRDDKGAAVQFSEVITCTQQESVSHLRWVKPLMLTK